MLSKRGPNCFQIFLDTLQVVYYIPPLPISCMPSISAGEGF